MSGRGMELHSDDVSNTWKKLKHWIHPEGKMKNLEFYKGLRPSKPEGEFIDNIHRLWYYKYDFIEEHTGYLQWLFPTFGSNGLNECAQPLQPKEAESFRHDFICSIRFLLSYRMILNFYGLVLLDVATGAIGHHPQIWQCRYANLNISSHNNTRITRILHSLGTLGFRRYVAPLVDFLNNEIKNEQHLPNCRNALEEMWLKIEQEFKDEPSDDSVFFHHLETNSQLYQKYKSALQNKCWLTTRNLDGHEITNEAEEKKAIEEFNQNLDDANKAQIANFDPEDLTKHVSSNNPAHEYNLSFFKQHYNSEEEGKKAQSEFLQKVDEGKHHLELEREKARKALRDLVHRNSSDQLAEDKSQA